MNDGQSILPTREFWQFKGAQKKQSTAQQCIIWSVKWLPSTGTDNLNLPSHHTDITWRKQMPQSPASLSIFQNIPLLRNPMHPSNSALKDRHHVVQTNWHFVSSVPVSQ